MTATDARTSGSSGPVAAGDVDLRVERRGEGPDVLLIAGLSDPAEAWEAQLRGLSDRYRLTAFDNRGAGRSPHIPEGFTVADTADDAAQLLRALGSRSTHVAGFSGGSAIAQELAIRHPHAVRSLVLAGGVDIATPARYGRIPGARFELLPEEAHQPFQERANEFNALVDGFWSKVDGRA